MALLPLTFGSRGGRLLVLTQTRPPATIEIAHQPGFQETQFPCDLLFEGEYDALLSAVASGAFDDLEDEVPWLDRLFLVRETADELDHPRSAVSTNRRRRAPNQAFRNSGSTIPSGR